MGGQSSKGKKGGKHFDHTGGAGGGDDADDDDTEHIRLADITAALGSRGDANGAMTAAAADADLEEGAHGSSTTTFAALGVRPWLDTQCKAMGFRGPTPVQAHAVPAILKGLAGGRCGKILSPFFFLFF
jgi:ATP-dependent RNA helicase DDX49/DBP8